MSSATGSASSQNGDDSEGDNGIEVLGADSSNGSDVLGQSSQDAAGTTAAGQGQAVPTFINAGAAAYLADNEYLLPASLAALGALLGLIALARRRRA